MRPAYHLPVKQLLIVGAVIVCLNFTAYRIVLGVEQTCSTRNCVAFSQWSVNVPNGQQCREAIGLELWAFLDSCCHPDTDSSWCTELTTRLNMGMSTRKILEYGATQCTEASCSREKTQVVTSSMFIENVNSARYECYDMNEE